VPDIYYAACRSTGYPAGQISCQISIRCIPIICLNYLIVQGQYLEGKVQFSSLDPLSIGLRYRKFYLDCTDINAWLKLFSFICRISVCSADVSKSPSDLVQHVHPNRLFINRQTKIRSIHYRQ
jgi:hypothetical protein